MDQAAEVYGAEPHVHPMIGGSGPAHAFIHILGVPVTSAGISYPGTRGHAPNENIRLDLFLKGAKHIARILKAYGDT
jgi:acetylornithine deacetylase/succinyl-diaminopimelate desuccinylase-like protein